ncbi:hypothetical protein FOWG_10186 [Fusarium oxysporum f. sp. lycopersici MN25]|nr:hypothetical protein FOWG_10186 [Fusarium oxysporum f. sp. lycopersici MN25]
MGIKTEYGVTSALVPSAHLSRHLSLKQLVRSRCRYPSSATRNHRCQWPRTMRDPVEASPNADAPAGKLQQHLTFSIQQKDLGLKQETTTKRFSWSGDIPGAMLTITQ